MLHITFVERLEDDEPFKKIKKQKPKTYPYDDDKGEILEMKLLL